MTAIALTPGSRIRRGGASFISGIPTSGYGCVDLDELRAPRALDDPGTFGAEDPHEAVVIRAIRCDYSFSHRDLVIPKDQRADHQWLRDRTAAKAR